MTSQQTSDVRLSSCMAHAFWELWRDIKAHDHTHYWLHGGRGSSKSSFISIAIVLLIIANHDANAVIVRKVANTMRDSVLSQIGWAIDTLGLTAFFKTTYSPMEITYLPTGQRIVFRGADDPKKLKSIKFSKGYAAVVWFEELDQFQDMAEIRDVLQSLMRGGSTFWVFYSYNPPRSRDSWVNREVLNARDDRLVHTSTYLDVPEEWLGQQFIDEAEELKRINDKAYQHEYLGIAVGTGGQVFENVESRPITDEERDSFEYIYNGCDFGYFPDPWCFVRCAYDTNSKTVYIFDCVQANKLSNDETADIIKDHLTYKSVGDSKPIFHRDLVRCDSAEPKSIADYKSKGLDARAVEKGPGSVAYGVKWLQTRAAIVIDPRTAAEAVTEFNAYAYEQNRQGEFYTGYVDADNHAIDATRYALQKMINRRN